MSRSPKRPRDPNQLAKAIIGEAVDRVADGKDDRKKKVGASIRGAQKKKLARRAATAK